MRTALFLLVVGTACTVSDKHPSSQGDDVDDMLPVDDDAIPDTEITAAPAEFDNSATATFRFTADYANTTYECAIDGETAVPCTSPYTRVLNDGPHSFSVRAISRIGKGDMTPAEHVWTIDTIVPSTTITEAPPAADNSTMVRFSFESSEENVTFDCAVDGGAFAPCESGAEHGPMGDGSHAFSVRAVDRAGNVDASPAVHAWSIDTSTPDTQLLSGPDGATASTTATFTFVSPDAGSGATYQCRLDGGAMQPCTSPHTINNLSMGEHTFEVRVRDAVGNLDPTPASRTWTVDVTAPETTIDSGPSGMTTTASAAFTFSSNESPVTFQCSLDGGAFVACTSPHNIMGLGQGEHTFAVRAIDSANHMDMTPATAMWIVDTMEPMVMIDGPAEGSTSGPRVVFTFSVNEGTPECNVDQGAFTACASPIGMNLPAAPHAFRVRATDGAGNSTTITRSWNVACEAPSIVGAAGLLHLDDTGQILANATGGPTATLGSNEMVENEDPSFGPGRFGGAVVFGNGDHVSWPVGLGASATPTFELWVRPDALGGTRDIAVSGDGAFAIRSTMVGPNSVRIQATAGGVVQSAPLAASAWHHVIASHDGATLRLWVDGARTEAPSSGTPVLDTIRLGSNFSGAIDETWVAMAPITDDESALSRYCPI